MKPHVVKYGLVYITPMVVLYSLWAADFGSYLAVFTLFGIIPFLELFTQGSTENLSAIEEAVASQDRTYDYLLYGLVPLQYLILGYFLFQMDTQNVPLSVQIGMTTAFGMACGVLGINAAHELGHRATRYEQFMSKALLLTTLYLHFFIEHNRGHHKRVSTDEDPASSRYGESVYAFYVRTIWGSWISAWRLEALRLKKRKQSFWSWHNEMLRFQALQCLFIGFIYAFFGWDVTLWFLGGAAIGCLLLETVNYIEHYGLRRQKIGDRYEKVLPIHSWNSNHPIGRLVLLELSRHSDHHYIASRKYQLLRHFDDSPQMPTGYPGMMLLALIPPIWYYVMHQRIAQLHPLA
ncbi:MAG: alkane 1-monooxygenase [Rhodothermia bacterium]|nr:alkane 1-monooxygenase [Rhodothermia bacterium]